MKALTAAGLALAVSVAGAQVTYTSNRTTWGGQAGEVTALIDFEELSPGTPVSLQYVPAAKWPGQPAPVTETLGFTGGQSRVLRASGHMTVEFPAGATAAGIRLRPGGSARLRAWAGGVALEPAPTSVCAVPPGASFSFCGLMSPEAFDTLTVENTLGIDARIDQIEIVAAPGPDPVTVCGVLFALLLEGSPPVATAIDVPVSGECAVLMPTEPASILWGLRAPE